MFDKLLKAIGIGAPPTEPKKAVNIVGPYRDESANLIYHLLFCDLPELFQVNFKGTPGPPWSLLFAAPPDHAALRQLADDPKSESRVRALAYCILRRGGQAVPAKQLLATIVEVGLEGGVDTLAAFADGGARYINHTGKMTIVEGVPNPFQEEIKSVIEASKPVVAAIGPWDKARRPAPPRGNLRMTFLVSDGLYFGEGQMEQMQREPMAAPVINAATTLLLKIVDLSTKRQAGQSTAS